MKPRSHSLNHVVWVTMTAIEVTPTSSVQMNAPIWSRRLAPAVGIWSLGAELVIPSKGLANAVVHAPLPVLVLTVLEQAVDRIELVPEVDARRADRCEVSQPRRD